VNALRLFEQRQELITATSYKVQSRVPLEIFQVFAKCLEMGTRISFTQDTVRGLSLPAKEFYVDDLLSQCSALETRSVIELISQLG
jgi:hypothetical protein